MQESKKEPPDSPKNAEKSAVRRDLELLKAVRRIMQAFDVHSRRMAAEFEITLPQLLCLMAVVAEEGMTSRRIAGEIFASASTLVGVLDRLETKHLIDRIRDPRDRRQIHIVPTEAGRRFIESAPSPFGERFDAAFAALPDDKRRELTQSLATLADLMGATARESG